MSKTPAQIEQAKHRASWCNQLATAMLVSGGINPVLTSSFGRPLGDQSGILYLAVFCLAAFMAVLTHIIGDSILSDL